MAFDTYGTSQSEGNKKEIDYDALNKYVVETCGLQERETLIGVVSGIVDLGTQDQPDAELEFDGDAAAEAEEIEKNPNTYFKTAYSHEKKKEVRYKCYPQRPVQCVAVSVDFPDIVVDKGQFFGESNPQPLRMYLGGTFFLEGAGMVVARPTTLKVNKKLGKWSFDQKHLFYKMAVASKLIKPGEIFVPARIDELLGKAFQFEAQVHMKENKGKEYFTEYIKFVSGLGRGQSAPELPFEPFLIQFNSENNVEELKNIRNHVLNTIRRASNYEGSLIHQQLKLDSMYKGEDNAPTVKKTEDKKANEKVSKPATTAEEFDDDIPF